MPTPIRRFKFLGPDIDSVNGPLKQGQIVEYDGQSATPDGGIPGEHWLEIEADGGH